MSWISKEHKILYSKTLNALYTDLSNGTGNVVEETGKLISTGYGKLKDGISYIGDRMTEKIDTTYFNFDKIVPLFDVLFRGRWLPIF